MRICTCGHTVADHRGWSGQYECTPWLERASDGRIYVGKCACRAGDYSNHPNNVAAEGVRL